jgi:hypothetical protein
MTTEPGERDRIRAAMDRILAGTPERCNGALTVVALAIEAGVPRNALTQRHTDLKDEFYQRIRDRGAGNEDEARAPRHHREAPADYRQQEHGTRPAPRRRPRTRPRRQHAHPGIAGNPGRAHRARQRHPARQPACSRPARGRAVKALLVPVEGCPGKLTCPAAARGSCAPSRRSSAPTAPSGSRSPAAGKPG